MWEPAAAKRILALVALVTLGGCHSGVRALLGQKPAYIGRVDPSYTLPRPTGGTLSLAAYRGRVVVANMWATWCPPCRAEIPALQHFAQRASKDVAVVGIDQDEPAATVAAFAREAGVTYPLAIDPGGRYASYYTVTSLPNTVFLNRRGIAYKLYVGPLDEATLAEIVAQAPR